MEVKPGYKETEVGVIPEDWSVVCAIDACSKIQDGTHFSPRIGGSDYLYVTSKNIRFGHLDMSTVSCIDAAQHQVIYRRCDVKKGDLLLTKDGANTGNAALNTLDEEFSLLSSVAFLRFDPRKHCAAYYLQQILTSQCQRQIHDAMAGNAITRLTLEKINKLRFPTPPTKAEQEAIAETLSDADALIESVEQLLVKKRQLKRGAMQELLTGKKRLSGFSGESDFKSDELGMLPVDWKMAPLKDLVDPSRGIRYGIVQPGKYDPNGRYMIRGQDYSESKGWAKPSDVFRVSDEVEERYRNARVKEGDIIMTIVGYCGHVEMVPKWLDGANLTQTTARIAIQQDKAIAAYCKYLLQSSIGKNQVAGYIKGAAQPGLNCGDVEQFLVILPSTPEQTAIAAILSDMDAEIAALEAKLVKARQLKQGMMQELLSGRIRLV